LLNEVFGAKKRISFEEFQRINYEVTSEMFLCIMILLQSQMPCSENFYRYKKNYEKYVGQNPSTKSAENSPKNKIESEQPKLIASPKMMSKLSPINSLANKQGLNFNPNSQRVLLQLAANKKPGEGPGEGQGNDGA